MPITAEAIVAAIAIVIALATSVYTALVRSRDKANEELRAAQALKMTKLEEALAAHEGRLQRSEVAIVRLETVSTAVEKLERAVERVEERLDAILLELQRNNKKG